MKEAGERGAEDYEYIREGTCSIFVFTQPLKGWRRVEALERRTKIDFAHQVEKLLMEDFLDADKVRFRILIEHVNRRIKEDV